MKIFSFKKSRLRGTEFFINDLSNAVVILHILFYLFSLASTSLSKTRHIELNACHSKILNSDWHQYPQLRYCCSQLLAGSILVQGQTSVLLNTVEPYARDSLIDAHCERRTPGSPSSYPAFAGRYGYVSTCLLPSSDGQKLIIGSRTCNLLVTASIRLDMQSVNVGPVTTHFVPTDSTRVFLDCASISRVDSMLADNTTNQVQQMLMMYQLKQVRSKFDHLSTYTMCRASSDIVSRLEMQPTTIWTISDLADRATMTQVKLISLLFRSITIQVINNGRDAVLTIDDLKRIGPLEKDSAVSKIITNIESLFSNDSSISIIGNTLLNSQLVDLAAIIAK